MDEMNSVVTEEESEYRILQYFTFRLGNETYGLNLENVKEVIEYGRIFPVPRTREYIRGVINLRGEVVPVIDLSTRFYGYTAEVTIHTSIVILDLCYNEEIMLVGAVIDAVDRVLDISEKDIETPPDFGSKIRTAYISGVGKAEDRFIILLNTGNVFNVDELSSMEIERKQS